MATAKITTNAAPTPSAPTPSSQSPTLPAFSHEEPVSDACRVGFGDGWADAIVGCSSKDQPSSFSCRGPRPFVCQATNISLNKAGVRVCAGGEPLETVLNRPEGEELPSLSPGALELACDMGQDLLGISLKQVFRNPILEGVVSSLKFLGRSNALQQCAHTEPRPTLAIARLDYADILHTYSELFHAYALLRSLGHAGPDTTAADLHQRVRLLLLDGHAQVGHACMCETVSVSVSVCGGLGGVGFEAADGVSFVAFSNARFRTRSHGARDPMTICGPSSTPRPTASRISPTAAPALRS
jgi:hypothetical protein